MHDGTEDPTAICALCGEDIYLGDLKVCRDCDSHFCEECQEDENACKCCSECCETSCKIVKCSVCGFQLCEQCTNGHTC